MTQEINGNRILSIGEVVKRSGVAISTIHFYESKGLITSTRNASNHRQYPSVVLRYLAIIRVAQRTGMTLEEIQKTLKAYQAGAKLNEDQWKKLTVEWQTSINQRIKRLERLRDELDNCIGCGCLSLKECPLRNPNDKLAKKGPGAQILERP